MTFEEFWKQNRERYLKLSKVNIMLAINTAAEESWEAVEANTRMVPNFQNTDIDSSVNIYATTKLFGVGG